MYFSYCCCCCYYLLLLLLFDAVLREEIRDLKLCLQSADKELAETKKEFKTYKKEGDTKISDLLARVHIIINNCIVTF